MSFANGRFVPGESCCVLVVTLPGSFLQVKPLGVFVLHRAIASRDGKREVHPHLLVTALISFLKT